MKTVKLIGPTGSMVEAVQLEQGEIVQAGDWYLCLGHCRSDWQPAEPGLKLKEFHRPHLRIIPNENPSYEN